MNGLVKEISKSLLSILSQLLMILSVIQILIFLTKENPEAGMFWVVGSGISGLITSSFILYGVKSGKLQNKLISIVLSILTIGIYILAVENFSDIRMFIGLFMSWLILILVVRE